jgi:hypothetical protein
MKSNQVNWAHLMISDVCEPATKDALAGGIVNKGRYQTTILVFKPHQLWLFKILYSILPLQQHCKRIVSKTKVSVS